MTKPTGRPRGRPPGSKNTKPRRPSVPAIAIGTADKARREARKEYVDAALDSLSIMRRGLQIMVNEIAPALKKIHDLAAETNDPKAQLAAVQVLKGTILDAHTIAKDLAPYEHRRLAGEKPLDQDKDKGPPILTLTAEEVAL